MVDDTDRRRLTRIKQRFVDLLADSDLDGPAAVVIADILRDELAEF